VVCEVFDADGNWLVTGGPWACEAGSGRIERIPVGQDRIFVVLAEDDLGNIRYQGETTGVSIEAGQNNQAVVIDAYLFVPTLSVPENAAQDVDLSAVSLEWEPVENADEYLVQVAKDVDFETLTINETTPATVYAAPPLEPLTEYFWKICAVDMQTNTGADSEVRSFVTSDCSTTIMPASNAFTNTGGTASIEVTSPSSHCTWSASASARWITITSDSSGSGNGTVTYSVSANDGAARSATITIAGQTHTVSQEQGGCTYTISPASRSVDNDGGAYNVTVTATHSGCEWSTSENVGWISLSPASGSGDGTVRVTVSANTGAARSATITIAGQTHTVSQEQGACTYSISPSSRSVDNDGGAYNVTVTAAHSGCEWSTSENVGWVSLSPASGSGDGTVRVNVSANTGAARSATITIAGRTHTVNQEEGPCTYTISPASQSVDNDGGAYNVTVTAAHSGCAWSTSENVDWISLSPSSGSGSGTVRVTVSANDGLSRSATITIAGRTHTVSQEQGACTYAVSPASQSVDNDGDAYDITVTSAHSGCAWSTSANVDWISLSPTSGSGDGTVHVTVSANDGEARSATITISGQTHTVNQEEGSCTYSISPTSQTVGKYGRVYDVTVTATHSGCEWTTSENYDWISLSPTSGSGSGTVRVTVSAYDGPARSATITIAGRDHTINQ